MSFANNLYSEVHYKWILTYVVNPQVWIQPLTLDHMYKQYTYTICLRLKLSFGTSSVHLSGWPSGLRRQTQGSNLAHTEWVWDFWSTYVGVGSNPTSDRETFFFFLSHAILEHLFISPLNFFPMYIAYKKGFVCSKIILSHDGDY